ncbi:hypothetical protein [Caproicibacterium amylolyticum]|uniref:Uncharacterized protein n=1 Tax=Caproicibacterium amylolyticum TaxID=2766537 RepID=A0A7G9WF59_9FIRM|nr:hypothetical protein [Caproicibacterium amylolyticum]MBE6722508.1 hypothetical protein [Oscillospiraceae bacterium]QNO17321.1 hypothetical protein H6X83_10250 [Caproicibacterium amylolyticum]
MNKVLKVLHVATEGFVKWINNARYISTFLLLLLFTFYLMTGTRNLCEDQNYSLTPWMFPFVMNRTSTVTVFLLIYIFLCCDAPFIDSQSPYTIIRAGRINWIIGKCLYVIATAFVFSIIVYLFSVIVCIPYVGFSFNWGKIIQMMAVPTSKQFISQYLMMGPAVSVQIMEEFQPLQATALTILLLWLVCSFEGMLMLTLNLYYSRTVGVVAATVLVFLSYFANQFVSIQNSAESKYIFYFSPASWVTLSRLSSDDRIHLSLNYEVAFLLIGICVFFFLSNRAMKHKEIEVLPEI